MKALTAIIHDTRREKKDLKYPVKIRITYQRKQVYYPTRFDLSIEEFNKLFTAKPREEYKKILLELTGLQTKAQEIIDDLKGGFNWKGFDAKFLKKKSDWNSVLSIYTDYSKALRAEERIGTALSYECSMNSVKKFTENMRKVSFDDITPEFLNKYENWMLGNGRSITTVGIYLRALRTVFNIAISDKIISRDFYPFGKGKYEIPTGKNVKKALKLSEVGEIYHYDPNPAIAGEEQSKAFWLLSYLSNGINPKDIALLKFKDIQGDFIIYERAKTKRSRRGNPTIITIPFTDDIKSIIERWGNKDTLPDNYIFPILERGITPERQHALIHQFVKVTNKGMRGIAKNLKLNKDVTTYTARHSYATVLKRSGASTEFISETLGHADAKTTKNYLDSFEDEKKLEMAKVLTAFKNS
ncbi:tyrosine-type recombinase/integrase [Chitinophaga defluvii]|uniref:Site-specific integrase n=1 Tax=Chitinophaga defluvii TaxID=3163343 RepID=A0ABV2T8W6_9BACT